MFGSVAPILEKDDEDSVFGDAFKVSMPTIFELIVADLMSNNFELIGTR